MGHLVEGGTYRTNIKRETSDDSDAQYSHHQGVLHRRGSVLTITENLSDPVVSYDKTAKQHFEKSFVANVERACGD